MVLESGAVRHWPQLDGVRGLAVLLVVLCHYRLRVPGGEAFSFGWTGVDLFFVLSGFLCASILLAEEPTARAAWRFVARRILRTWPAYYALLAALSIWIPVPAPYLFHGESYMLGAVEPRIYLFAWSLAVEEHFYVALPFAWLLLGRRGLPSVLVACIAVSVALRYQFLSHHAYWSAYTITMARLDGLAVGCLLAIYRERVTRGLAMLGVGVLVGVLPAVELASVRSGGASVALQYLGPVLGAVTPLLVAVGFAGLISLSLQDERWARALSWTPLRDLGRVAYGVYLYHCVTSYAGEHFLVPWLLRHEVYSTSARMGSVCLEALVTIALVKLSWRWIEQPFLRLKSRL